MKSKYKVLKKPLNADNVDSDGWVCGVVAVHLSDVIDHDLEGFLDLLSTRLTGTDVLSDISWRLVGHDNQTLHLEVKGDAGLCWNDE